MLRLENAAACIRVADSIVVGRELVDGRPAVSRRHCVFVVADGRAYVQDVGSTNGTKVNGEAIAPWTMREVKDGDRVDLGPYCAFIVRMNS